MAPENWKFRECFELMKLSIYSQQIGSKLKKTGVFSGREYRELAEITEMINETIVQVALQ